MAACPPQSEISEVYMEIFRQIKEILTELLDIEEKEITPESYLIRDLGVESIDLLELAVAINARWKIKVNDDDIFLRPLRLYLKQAKENRMDPALYLAGKFPFLTEERIREILTDLEQGPTLKVKDLVSYVVWQRG
jgi:acyl carrier protein